MHDIDHLIVAAMSFCGALIAGFGMLPFYKRHFRWSQRHIEQLRDYAQWSHKAIRLIAERMGISVEIGMAPLGQKVTPPPALTPTWQEITNPDITPKRRKGDDE